MDVAWVVHIMVNSIKQYNVILKCNEPLPFETFGEKGPIIEYSSTKAIK
jgi:hypothetical protein